MHYSWEISRAKEVFVFLSYHASKDKVISVSRKYDQNGQTTRKSAINEGFPTKSDSLWKS